MQTDQKVLLSFSVLVDSTVIQANIVEEWSKCYGVVALSAGSYHKILRSLLRISLAIQSFQPFNNQTNKFAFIHF